MILVEVPIPTVVVTPTKSTNPTDCVAIPIEVPFGFSNKGSEIIFNGNK